MLKAIRVSVMLLVLASSAYAGEVLTPPAPQPPPTSTAQEPANGVTFNGEISTPDVTESLTQTALELLAVLASIF